MNNPMQKIPAKTADKPQVVALILGFLDGGSGGGGATTGSVDGVEITSGLGRESLFGLILNACSHDRQRRGFPMDSFEIRYFLEQFGHAISSEIDIL